MTSTRWERDRRLMAAALRLARRNLGRTWPNPAVGCLIVTDSGDIAPRIVGRGWTGVSGRPHGETEALAQAGNQARGATAYVTLEPCSHHGETPPCAEALVRAGVARVVSALEDPDPRVAGRGHAMLQEAGIEVSVGVMVEEAAALNEGFLKRVRSGLPHVQLKLAVSRDGMIAGAPGERTAITGPVANNAVHMMRARADAVLVGAGTWRADNPELTCRLPGMASWSPVRVALDARCELPPESQLLATIAQAPVWIIAAEGEGGPRRTALENQGATIIDVPADAGGNLDLAAVLRALGDRGITRLMVEGGAHLARNLVVDDLIDEAAIFTGEQVVGPGGVPALSGLSLDLFDDNERFVLVRSDMLGPDTLRVFRRKR